MAMTSAIAEVVARIQCEIGINNVHVRPIGLKKWGITYQLDMYHAETLFSAETQEECERVLALAVKKN